MPFLPSGTSLFISLQTSPAPTQPAGSGQIITQMPPDLMRGSQLMGIDVYGADNQKIGDVDEVLVGKDGKIQAIVVGVGGFLGIGGKDSPFPMTKCSGWPTTRPRPPVPAAMEPTPPAV